MAERVGRDPPVSTQQLASAQKEAHDQALHSYHKHALFDGDQTYVTKLMVCPLTFQKYYNQNSGYFAFSQKSNRYTEK